jgi:hypothetical protein
VTLRAGDVPALILGRGGRVLPTAVPAAHTGAMDFSAIELWALGTGASASGVFCGPEDAEPTALEVRVSGANPALVADPAGGRVKWTFRRLGA